MLPKHQNYCGVSTPYKIASTISGNSKMAFANRKPNLFDVTQYYPYVPFTSLFPNLLRHNKSLRNIFHLLPIHCF